MPTSAQEQLTFDGLGCQRWHHRRHSWRSTSEGGFDPARYRFRECPPGPAKAFVIAGTETDPEPETSGDAGAAAFLHGPARLFATVATPDTTDDDHDDQVHDEAEMEAR